MTNQSNFADDLNLSIKGTLKKRKQHKERKNYVKGIIENTQKNRSVGFMEIEINIINECRKLS